MNIGFWGEVYNIFIYGAAVIYIVYVAVHEIRNRQKIKLFKVVDGVIKEVNSLDYDPYDEQQIFRFELVVCFVYQNEEYTIAEKVVEKLYKHRPNNIVLVYVNSDDVSKSTIAQPYTTTDIFAIVFKLLPVVCLLILLAYINS